MSGVVISFDCSSSGCVGCVCCIRKDCSVPPFGKSVEILIAGTVFPFLAARFPSLSTQGSP